MTDGYMRSILAKCKAQGCAIDSTRRGHIRVRTPSGKQVITSGTPSDRRATYNFLATLNRNGVDITSHETPNGKQADAAYYKEWAALLEQENADFSEKIRALTAERDLLKEQKAESDAANVQLRDRIVRLRPLIETLGQIMMCDVPAHIAQIQGILDEP